MPDGLTGLMIYGEIMPSAFDGNAIAVFVDIDGFNWFNYMYGHLAGDQVLIEITDVIVRRAATVRSARAYRVEGDGFLVIDPEASLDSALELARTIVEDVRGLRIAYSRDDQPARTRLEVNAVVIRFPVAAYTRYFGSHSLTDEFQLWVWSAIQAKKRETGSQAGVVAVCDGFGGSESSAASPILIAEKNCIKFGKLRVRVVKGPHTDSLFILPDEGDMHAHDAWAQIDDALVNKAQFLHIGSTGALAFAEFADTYKSNFGEIRLIHEADPGELSITSTTSEALSQVVECLKGLARYTVEFVD